IRCCCMRCHLLPPRRPPRPVDQQQPQLTHGLRAKDLKPGYRFVTADNRKAEVVKTRTWKQHQQVYNLTVDGLHTYHVLAGTTPILVHNCGRDADEYVGKHRGDGHGQDPGYVGRHREPDAGDDALRRFRVRDQQTQGRVDKVDQAEKTVSGATEIVGGPQLLPQAALPDASVGGAIMAVAFIGRVVWRGLKNRGGK
ncbi:polymorphic toxin-type HINT domain-containing protein, partial [Pilimelia columellifera]|uniref:polymorphic toxin-type HINT domain-containing protein n=1 Tax=Pilimelia columellifera TaxID=706574 RepID=UPI0031E01E41